MHFLLLVPVKLRVESFFLAKLFGKLLFGPSLSRTPMAPLEAPEMLWCLAVLFL